MQRVNRRQFIKAGSAAAGLWVAGTAAGYVSPRSPNEKLNIAFIGVGGRGGSHVRGMGKENVVALCDVNEKCFGKAAKTHPSAKKYVDFRKLFDDAKSFDAVVVSTCEHTHAFATLPALQLGKHVYCEKPLTHGIWESRVVSETAAKNPKLVTQMGIQLHASENYRQVVNLIQAGVVGPVREAHIWVSRAWGWQSPADAKKNKDIVSVQDRPKESMPVPEGLHWDLWLGPAPARPFHSVYFPGPKWYRWWDFGSGTMSDLGSHRNDLAFWALKLDAPLTVEGFGPPVHPEIAPASFRAVYEYGPRGELPAVKLVWYQGAEKPPQWHRNEIPRWGNGCLFVGEKGMLLADYGKFVLLPEDKFKGYKAPPRKLPKSPGHQAEWLQAIKTGSAALAPFSYSGPLTEANHLASIAYRLGKKLEWDAAAMKAKNAPEADPLVKRAYREGWKLA